MAKHNPFSSFNGWKSRKLWFSVFAIGVLYLGTRGAIESLAFGAIYSTFSGAVVAIAGLFLAGNAASKFIGLKAAAPAPKAKSETPPTEPPNQE